MLHYALIVLALFAAALYAAPSKVEIYAGILRTKNDRASLSNDIVVVYGNYILTAKRALYDKTKGILELFDNVKVYKKGKYKILGNYAKLDLKNKKKDIQPFYMLDTPSNVWMSAKRGCDYQKEIDIKDGVLSGCDPKAPLWQIEFTSSDYDKESKWLNVYNAVLYIYDIPVIYTPYFGYSLDTTRRSGLLPPSLGYSTGEGLFYKQPIYIAKQNWWDMEFDPQIRNQRGKGIYTTFRFVDTRYSFGQLTLGEFQEKERYFKKHNLQNEKHYGGDFTYTNTNVLKSFFNTDTSSQSVLYIDAHKMNDVDYINLSTNDTTEQTTPSQVISRINAFYNTDRSYFGVYFKYYDDLSKKSNAKTLQQLPTFHYHKYIDTLLQNHLLYDFNVKTTNLYRPQGVTAIQTDFSVPIKIRATLFDEYLNIGFLATVSGQYSRFKNDGNNDYRLPNGYYIKNTHQISLSTQLTRSYEGFVHTVSFSSSYTKKGGMSRSGFYRKYQKKNTRNGDVDLFYKLSDTKEAIAMNFRQFFYDTSGKELLYHRLTNIIADPFTNKKEVGNLENELVWSVTDSIKYYNNFFYDFKKKRFSKQLNQISFFGQGLVLSLSHFYKKNFDTDQKTNYYTSSLDYKYNTRYSYHAAYRYDIEKHLKKGEEIGFLYQKRCWNFGIKYVENNRPILLTGGKPASIYDRYVYFTITLKPIMKSNSKELFIWKLPPKTIDN